MFPLQLPSLFNNSSFLHVQLSLQNAALVFSMATDSLYQRKHMEMLLRIQVMRTLTMVPLGKGGRLIMEKMRRSPVIELQLQKVTITLKIKTRKKANVQLGELGKLLVMVEQPSRQPVRVLKDQRINDLEKLLHRYSL